MGPPIVCFVPDIRPPVVEQGLEGADVAYLSIDVSRDGARKGRVHLELAGGSKH